jgi:hypothetical protein
MSIRIRTARSIGKLEPLDASVRQSSERRSPSTKSLATTISSSRTLTARPRTTFGCWSPADARAALTYEAACTSVTFVAPPRAMRSTTNRYGLPLGARTCSMYVGSSRLMILRKTMRRVSLRDALSAPGTAGSWVSSVGSAILGGPSLLLRTERR